MNNKNWLGFLGVLIVVLLIVWLLGGNKISCRESYWDKDKQIIEIKHK